MKNICQNSNVIIGIPLLICGIGIGLNHLLRDSSISYVPVAFIISGLALMLIGWSRSKS
jgi:hypothetical protein